MLLFKLPTSLLYLFALILQKAAAPATLCLIWSWLWAPSHPVSPNWWPGMDAWCPAAQPGEVMLWTGEWGSEQGKFLFMHCQRPVTAAWGMSLPWKTCRHFRPPFFNTGRLQTVSPTPGCGLWTLALSSAEWCRWVQLCTLQLSPSY